MSHIEQKNLPVLRRYGEKYNEHLTAALPQRSAREALRRYFDQLVEQLSDHHVPPGCLLANTVMAPGTTVVDRILQRSPRSTL